MDIKELLGLLPEDKQADARVLLDGIVIDSKEKAQKLVSENTYLKAVTDSLTSARVDNALERFKAEKLEAEVEKRIKERNPAKSPVEIELESIKSELAKTKQEAKRKESLTKLLEKAQKDGLAVDADILGSLIVDDDEATEQRYAKFSTGLKSFVDSKIEATLKEKFGNVGKPGEGSSKPNRIARPEFDKLAPIDQLKAIKEGAEVVDQK